VPVVWGDTIGADGGGNFASGAPVIVPPGRMVIAVAAAGYSATLTGVYRNGQTATYPAFPTTGSPLRFSYAAGFQAVKPSAADANINWFTVADGPLPPFDTLASLLAATAGVPFVTVGNGMGYNFGPIQNPASTFYGLDSAIAAVTNVANKFYGLPIYVYLNGPCAVTGTLDITTPNLVIYQNGNGSISDAGHPVTPTGYFNYTGVGGTTVDIITVDNVSGITWHGLAIQVAAGTTNIESVLRVTGARNVYFDYGWIFDPNAATAATGNHVGLLLDGATKTGDRNHFSFMDISAAISWQGGLTTSDSKEINDTIFDTCSFNGTWSGSAFVCDPTTNCVVSYQAGNNNISMINAIAGNTPVAGGQYVFDLSNATGGSISLYGGECGTAAAGGGVLNMGSAGATYFTFNQMQVSSGNFNVAGGYVVFNECDITSSSATFAQSGGSVAFTNTLITQNSFAYTQTGGFLVIAGGYTRTGWTLNGGEASATGHRLTSGASVAMGGGIFAYDHTNDFSAATITGSSGTIIPSYTAINKATAGNYGWGTYSFTGTLQRPYPYPTVVAQSALVGSTSTQTLTFAGVAAASTYRVTFRIRVTVAGTSTIPALTYNNQGNSNTGPTAAAVWKFDGSSVAPIYSIVANGEYQAEVVFGCGSNGPGITMTITPTGSTFSWSMTVEQLGP